MTDRESTRTSVEVNRLTRRGLRLAQFTDLLNCEERVADDPAGLAQRMADLMGLDSDRVRQWLFGRCVIVGVEDPTLQAVAATLAPS